MNTDQRREKVRRILIEHYDEDETDDDADPCPVNLLADILHYCDRNWGRFDDAYETAKMHHKSELLAEVKRLKIYERVVLCIAYHQQLPDGLYVDEELMLRAREHLRKNGQWEEEEE